MCLLFNNIVSNIVRFISFCNRVILDSVQIKYQAYINAKRFDREADGTDLPMAGEYQMRAA